MENTIRNDRSMLIVLYNYPLVTSINLMDVLCCACARFIVPRVLSRDIFSRCSCISFAIAPRMGLQDVGIPIITPLVRDCGIINHSIRCKNTILGAYMQDIRRLFCKNAISLPILGCLGRLFRSLQNDRCT